ncbi:V-snare-domain-containing protein [Tilletiaria anomala UBC 951]|uniref:V-snare-domain-containing protein n=1 Tax=Tilletiaria anomala (strain ATCC 24038 / CBS 436.72 / UBC 951) TaxID=1037660 RepID=A0A066V376_TILAU|nr:V-snare-domain-containing protein [Tilletiaria anomala UBC 951]KDN35856.1 V-snare-domain-containing protein [Tilletiaria anomala UBC 951]
MADLFESYASDFASLTESIRSKLQHTGTDNATGEARKASLRRAQMEADEADEVLGQMDIELQNFPQSIKSRYALKVREAKTDLEKLKKEISGTLTAFSGSRSAYDPHAFGESGGDLEAGAGSNDPVLQRQRLLQGTARLEDGSRRLDESNRIALETETLGADILRDLRSQREQIENARDTLREADGSIDRSSRTLTKMIRQAKRQKIVTAGIITVLVLLILLILYSKIF